MSQQRHTTNAFCSIVTMSYLAYARTLDKSLKANGNNEPHYTLVVDYLPEHADLVRDSGLNVITLKDLAIPNVDELLERFNLFEFVNVMKPFFARWIFQAHPEVRNLIYLDSDMCVYEKFSDIFDYLDTRPEVSVALMPHLISKEVIEEYIKRTDYTIEQSHFAFGLYNAGIYAFKNDANARKFLDWHAAKISRYGFNIPEFDLFTDQKVLDMSGMVFDFVGLYRNSGYNVAPWNLIRGTLSERDGKYYAGHEPLVFFHFSRVHKENPDGTLLFPVSAEDERLYRKLITDYRARLVANGHEKTKDIPYAFKDRHKPQPVPVPRLYAIKELEELKIQNNKFYHEIITKTIEIQVAQGELYGIYSSRSWKLVSYLRKAAVAYIPNERLRRTGILFAWKIFVSIRNILRKIKAGMQLLAKPVKRPRLVNLKSKKIVFVGHSYHAKTKSMKFLVDYLKESFDVETVYDESWMGKRFPDISFIDESYLGVIFWQTLPSPETLNKLGNNNIMFFPMYDASKDLDRAFWKQISDLKIVSFSKTLHENLTHWHIPSMSLRYFPKPPEFFAGDPKKVFFWQRRTEISFERIKHLFAGQAVSVHIHKALDPYQEFVRPSPEDEKTFNITYSDWYETKEGLWEEMKKCAIYIAPREYEGIGMSFLEAMAMGKAVIACDNPTMNEYIENGRTGYLFNLKKPEPIDLSKIKEVQKNAHDYMKAGYEQWMAERGRIVDFIRQK